jgi:hypothetical protein
MYLSTDLQKRIGIGSRVFPNECERYVSNNSRAMIMAEKLTFRYLFINRSTKARWYRKSLISLCVD